MAHSPEPQLQAGQVIAERYRLEEPIGRGAMGAVWRAVHLRLESPVAIKFLNPAIANEPVMLERFLREARSAAAVRSSHVVQIFDYGVDDGKPYIAMELLVGEGLDARLAAREVLTAPELDKIFGEVARAVGVAHELGVVHRDIKPANIFITREGDHEVTKVLDFGIAKLVAQHIEAPASSSTNTGIILGTPNYMSPEQARGHRRVDHRSDLWSMAMLAFECLTGRQPFESSSLGDLVVKICTTEPLLPSSVAALPASFDRWFLRGVEKDPEQRFSTAAEMAAELHALLAAEGLGAQERPRSVPRRLELVHTTEVIPSTTARMLAQAALADSASDATAGVEPALTDSSHSAKPVAGEVLTRSPPARRRTLVAVGIALAAAAAALTWPSPRRTEPLARPAAPPTMQSAVLPPAPSAPAAPAPLPTALSEPPEPVLAASTTPEATPVKAPEASPVPVPASDRPAPASERPPPRARPIPAKPAPAARPNETPSVTPYPRPAPPADPYADRL
jgi:serine/threonine-protein kinase